MIIETGVARKAGAVVEDVLPKDSAEVAGVDGVRLVEEEFQSPFKVGKRSPKVAPPEFGPILLKQVGVSVGRRVDSLLKGGDHLAAP